MDTRKKMAECWSSFWTFPRQRAFLAGAMVVPRTIVAFLLVMFVTALTGSAFVVDTAEHLFQRVFWFVFLIPLEPLFWVLSIIGPLVPSEGFISDLFGFLLLLIVPMAAFWIPFIWCGSVGLLICEVFRILFVQRKMP